MSLTEENLRLLNDEQRSQVLLQWERQQHEDFSADFQITPFGEVLEEFSVRKGVWNPFVTTARHHAAYMFYHNELYRGGDAIDIGCGTGIMGIVMAKNGARRVQMSDLSAPAVENARENTTRYKLEWKVSIAKRYFFKGIEMGADCITYNQPFFPGVPPADDTIAASMLAHPNEIRNFLKVARDYLNRGGVIVMPSFNLAGNLNNPYVAGQECGYDVITPFRTNCKTGLQRGEIAVHELRLR